MVSKPHKIFNYLPGFSPVLAEGFYRVGYDLAKQLHGDTSYLGLIRIAPAVVNFNLSAELYLKAIHMITLRKRPLGHKLLNLYNALPADIKGQLEQDYLKNKMEPRKELTSYRIKMMPKDMNDDGPKVPKAYVTITSLLEAHQDAFAKWRYLFEIGYQNTIIYEYDFFSMNCFITAIQNYIGLCEPKFNYHTGNDNRATM